MVIVTCIVRLADLIDGVPYIGDDLCVLRPFRLKHRVFENFSAHVNPRVPKEVLIRHPLSGVYYKHQFKQVLHFVGGGDMLGEDQPLSLDG